MTDSVSFLDYNGTEYTLHTDSTKMVTSISGAGLPEIEHYSQKTPFEHGEQHLGYNFRPRKMAVAIYRNPTTRDALYADHQTLLTAFNPYKGVGRLKWTLNDGTTIRYLDVWISGGLKFETEQQPAFKHQFDIIELTAFSPFWYNPTVNSTEMEMATTSSPLFPITFPFMLSGSGITVSTSITNNGHVDAYPTITVHGPGINPIIRNVTTDKKLEVTYTLLVNETITIDCGIGKKTVTHSNGVTDTSILGYLSSDSEFWSMQPGANTISCGMTSTTADSSIVVAFYDQYLGV